MIDKNFKFVKNITWKGILLPTLFLVSMIIAFDFSHTTLEVEENLLEQQLGHLELITKEPHPTGSEYHLEIKNYLKEEINKTNNFELISQTGKDQETDLNLENIITVKRGSTSNESVLISAHYDSEFLSPGANDDGLAVASMLSLMDYFDDITINKNIIFLFSDAEEMNLAGAKLFLDQYKDNDLGEIINIFNFEARGAFGPIYLFEAVNSSDEQTTQVINKIKISNNHTLTNTVYERLPNRSDLTILRQLGIPGYNFGYFRGIYAYHTPQDNLENTSIETRTQQLKIMKNIIQEFALQDLEKDVNTTDNSIIFFNLYTGLNIAVDSLLLSLLSILAIFSGLLVTSRNLKKTSQTHYKVIRLVINIALLGLGFVILESTLPRISYFTINSLLILMLTVSLCTNFIVQNLGNNGFKLIFTCLIGILGLTSLLNLAILYPFVIASALGLLATTLQRKLKIVRYIILVLIHVFFVPILWEFAWIYDNRLITLVVMLAANLYLSMLSYITLPE